MSDVPKIHPAIHYAETRYGFAWGAAKITRCFSEAKNGSVVLLLTTPKQMIQLYVTKTGKVRIADAIGEWARKGGA